ncbi:MAG: SPFH/Band 7/PHB domain protein [Paludibacteraceae bacterium]|jgi:regulator of protease activity HflC (stomatin/prohibitin superfamily)|nr:SPFH/Band 7/PHB domain protein [Paludibacteraceae bacterium]OQA48151.1 MAG: Modulator of FtsH protease HflK [Bacteroidetes bacterium ADurb.Bin302]HOH96590.1 SPFH domain-containing protein [Candidatus Enterocola sp.]HPG55203.1 SPFH domain-containing protein [Candidatus Enterocola sp.]
MNAGTIVLLILVLLVVIYVMRGFKIVSQSETMIIERLGKYQRTITAGINIILPIVERAKDTITRMPNGSLRMNSRIDLREQVYDFDKQSVITKDNVMTEINALLYFQIVDPMKSVYEIQNLPLAIEKLTQTTLRNVVGEMELDETLTSRDTINTKLRNVLDEATNKWGVKVNRVELQDITPPESIRFAMEKQMQAERDKRAEILKSEGEKQSAILKSEGEKSAEINAAEAEKQAKILKAQGHAEAQILQAEAEAKAIRKISEAVAAQQGANPVNYLLAIKYIDGLKEMVSGKDNKTIYLPYEATGVLSSLGGIKDMFKNQ